MYVCVEVDVLHVHTYVRVEVDVLHVCTYIRVEVDVRIACYVQHAAACQRIAAVRTCTYTNPVYTHTVFHRIDVRVFISFMTHWTQY